ncbi:hypothetical protein B0H13DRAFT_1115680 [Mycena leptocephala]|nr:hypothetical protein B0H13DRAFT_1115680 [Mycena leptocephala]
MGRALFMEHAWRWGCETAIFVYNVRRFADYDTPTKMAVFQSPNRRAPCNTFKPSSACFFAYVLRLARDVVPTNHQAPHRAPRSLRIRARRGVSVTRGLLSNGRTFTSALTEDGYRCIRQAPVYLLVKISIPAPPLLLKFVSAHVVEVHWRGNCVSSAWYTISKFRGPRCARRCWRFLT